MKSIGAECLRLDSIPGIRRLWIIKCLLHICPCIKQMCVANNNLDNRVMACLEFLFK